VLAVLHAPRFVDRTPAHVVATLLDEQTYYCYENGPRSLAQTRGAWHSAGRSEAWQRGWLLDRECCAE
jgi:hypothetical protein